MLLPSITHMQNYITMGGLAAPNWSLSLKVQLCKLFIELLISKALWARVARQDIEEALIVSYNINLTDFLSQNRNTRGWPGR